MELLPLLLLAIGALTAILTLTLAESASVPLSERFFQSVEPKWTRGEAPALALTKPTIAVDIRPAIRQPYGVGVYAEQVLRELARQDQAHRYVLWSVSRKDTLPAWVSDIVQMNKNFRAVHAKIPNIATSWAAALTNLRQLEAITGHVQIFHSPYLTIRPRGSIAITHLYDLSFALHREFRNKSDPYELAALHSSKRADRIITVSQESRHQIESLLGIPRSRISVVYGAADRGDFHVRRPDEIQSILKEFGLEYKQFFLYVGDWHERKNLVRIIQATIELSRKGKSIPLALAGVSRSHLPTQFRSEHSKIIRPLGYVTRLQLAALYSGALALVFASLYEGFGLPLIEAMASGTPVITSRSFGGYGGALEEVSGGASELVDPTSEESIANAMHMIASDEDRREHLSEAGLSRAEAFSWENAAKEILTIYDDVLT